MSLIATALAFIFAILGFLFSLPGLFTLLVGVVLFILLPIIPKATGEFKKFAHLPLYLATTCVNRAAIVVSEHNDLLFKSMQFDDLGVELISFGQETKEFEDPAATLHHWKGIPFALADEVHGVLFDPRFAALGARKHAADEKGVGRVRASQDTWDAESIHEWVLGVFEFPEGKYELVDLSHIRHIIDGGERSEYPNRVEELYKNSRIPFSSGTGISKFFYPVFAFLAIFGGIWLIASQGGGGGGGGADTVIGFGSTLLGILSSRKSIHEYDLKRIGVVLAIGVPLPLIFLVLAVFVGPFTAIIAYIVLGMGFWLLPILSVLARASSKLSGGFATMFLMLGFIGFDRPVFEWTPSGYRVREWDDLPHAEDRPVKWYGMANSLVGFTFEPQPESWGAAHMEKREIESQTETASTPTGDVVAADGGTSEIPAGYRRLELMKRAGLYGAFAPKRLKHDCYYLNTGIALGRFTDAAVGEKSLQRLLWAKEKYGEDAFGVSDKAVLYMTGGAGLIAALLGTVVFLL